MTYTLPIKSVPLVAAVALVTIGGFGNEPVYAGSCCEQGASSTVADQPSCHSSAQRTTRDTPPFRPPHGGQLSKTIWNYYEVVYGPRETRVYVYDMFRERVSTRGIQGLATMRVRSSGQSFDYPLRYVPVQNGQDYLVTDVDLSHVRDGDMDVEFNLSSLPHESEPTARFTQVYASSASQYDANLAVGAVAAATAHRREYDVAAAAAEEHCHIEGTSAGGCSCGGCGGRSASATAPSPAAIFSPVATPGTRSVVGLRRLPAATDGGNQRGDMTSLSQPPGVVVVGATAADSAAIQAQRVCPVTNNRLGSHGPPTKLLVNGRPLFVCCQGCVGKVEENPEMYLARVSR